MPELPEPLNPRQDPQARGWTPVDTAILWTGPADPAQGSKRITFQHTFPLPRRPRAGTKQTTRARKKLPKPKPKGDGKRPPATKAKDPETARETRREYDQARNRTPERREYQRQLAQEQRQRAKELGKCRNCPEPAIPGQTRCTTCAEAHRQSRRQSDANRRAAAKEKPTTGQADQRERNGV